MERRVETRSLEAIHPIQEHERFVAGRALIDRADLHLSIPGTGAVESLNVAASAAVLFGEYWRQRHHAAGARAPRR